MLTNTASPRWEETKHEEDDLEEINLDEFERKVLPVVKEGYLFKKKQKGLRFGVFNWQCRYFVIDNVKCHVRYGPHEISEEGSRYIPFDEINKVVLSKTLSTNEVEKKKGLPSGEDVQFEVELTKGASNNNGSRVFIFRANNREEAAAWVAALQFISVSRRREEKITEVVESKIRRMSQIETTKNVLQQIEQRNVLGKNREEYKESKEGSSAGDWQMAMRRYDFEEKDDYQNQEVKAQSPPVISFEMEIVSPSDERPRTESDVSDESKNKLKTLTQRIVARARDRKSREKRKQALQIDTNLQSSDNHNRLTSSKTTLHRACFPCFMFCFKSQPELSEDHDLSVSHSNLPSPTTF